MNYDQILGGFSISIVISFLIGYFWNKDRYVKETVTRSYNFNITPEVDVALKQVFKDFDAAFESLDALNRAVIKNRK